MFFGGGSAVAKGIAVNAGKGATKGVVKVVTAESLVQQATQAAPKVAKLNRTIAETVGLNGVTAAELVENLPSTKGLGLEGGLRSHLNQHPRQGSWKDFVLIKQMFLLNGGRGTWHKECLGKSR